ncbi:MAG: NYN domain-containing protein [Anaerolineae bacterium]|nr:NYN domain-containing protein [Anaerolineae bacterium]
MQSEIPMPYIIDGHNLIHYLDDIELDDPHDEAKLVIKIRGFCARTRKKCVVVFDEGLPGGTSSLSTHSVKVVFAASRQSNADRIIRERIRLARDVKGWIVITSDNEILDAARQVGMRGIKCADFAEMLLRPVREKLDRGEQPHVMVSEAEVEEFLDLFSVDDSSDESDIELADMPSESPVIESKQDKPTVSKPVSKKSTAPSKVRIDNSNAGRVRQSEQEIEQWLEIFGEESNREPTEKAAKIVSRESRKQPQEAQPAKSKKSKAAQPSDAVANENLKQSDLLLPRNTVDAWMNVFGETDDEIEATDPAPQRSDPSKQGRYKDKDGKRQPLVHKGMATSDEVFLNAGEVDAWMDVFGVTDTDEEDDE